AVFDCARLPEVYSYASWRRETRQSACSSISDGWRDGSQPDRRVDARAIKESRASARPRPPADPGFARSVWSGIRNSYKARGVGPLGGKLGVGGNLQHLFLD